MFAEPNTPASSLHATFFTLASLAICITGLYLASSLLIPIALAILFSFLLAPLVRTLERFLGRLASVLLATGLAGFVLIGVLSLVTQQILTLAGELPRYEDNLRARVRSMNLQVPGVLSEALLTISHLNEDVSNSVNGSAELDEDLAETAVPVRMADGKFSLATTIVQYVTPAVTTLLKGLLVCLLVVYILAQREDLAERFSRLVTFQNHSLTRAVTVQAIEEAGTRISRYLLAQLTVNLCYGVPVGVGLWLFGLPGGLLWGALATLLRFIPYLGPWIAAGIPMLLSLAVFPDWRNPLLLAGFLIVLELITNNVLEPLIYSAGAGISPIAVLAP